MRASLILFYFAVTIGLTGCGDSDSTSTQLTPIDSISAEFQGFWTAPGHASTLVIGKDRLDLYQHTRDYCLHVAEEKAVTTENISNIVRKTADKDVIEWYMSYGTADFSAPGRYFERRSDLPTACKNNLIAMLDGSNATMSAPELWDFFGQIFEENYIGLELRSIDWQQVLYNAGTEINEGSSDESVFNAMAETLIPLADSHNYVQSQFGWYAKTLTKPTIIQKLIEEFAFDNGLPLPIPETQLTAELVAEINAFIDASLAYQWELVTKYAREPGDIKHAADGLIRWFENEGIGYLYIGGMLGYADPELDSTVYAQRTLRVLNTALDEALSDLQHTNGLIVDVRTNDGGHDFVGLAIASRFTDTKVHVYSKQARDGQGLTPIKEVYLEPYAGGTYARPISLLISASTVSAAETFSLTMAQLPQVTLIGEPSHGAFSDVMEWSLPNGFDIGLSYEFYLSPEGVWYEQQGIPVDINVPFFTAEQRDSEIDVGIETAFAVLSE